MLACQSVGLIFADEVAVPCCAPDPGRDPACAIIDPSSVTQDVFVIYLGRVSITGIQWHVCRWLRCLLAGCCWWLLLLLLLQLIAMLLLLLSVHLAVISTAAASTIAVDQVQSAVSPHNAPWSIEPATAAGKGSSVAVVEADQAAKATAAAAGAQSTTKSCRGIPRQSTAACGALTTAGCAFCTPNRKTCLCCRAGMFAAEDGTCTPCELGTVSLLGATKCTTCPDGFTTRAKGQSRCDACLPGWYTSGKTCVRCKKGTTSKGGSLISKVQCNRCPKGSTTSGTGSAACDGEHWWLSVVLSALSTVHLEQVDKSTES